MYPSAKPDRSHLLPEPIDDDDDDKAGEATPAPGQLSLANNGHCAKTIFKNYFTS